MELRNPFVLFIGIPIILIICLVKFKKKKIKDGEAKKVANTEYVKSTADYKELYLKYKIYKYSILSCASLSLLFALVLIARPYETQREKIDQYKRDIFLCMDVSGSMDSINGYVSETMQEMVKGLDGDRVGIVLFNSSAVTCVALTDDYSYVLQVLETLHKSFTTSYVSGGDNTEYNYLSGIKENGTNERPGSSIMSDSLASCALNFPDLDKERTRIIIFSTDNYQAGEALLTMDEACSICKEKGVKVYAVMPKYVGEEKEFNIAIKKTGGRVYKNENADTVPEVIRAIDEEEKSLIDSLDIVHSFDKPKVPYIFCFIFTVISIILLKKVNL